MGSLDLRVSPTCFLDLSDSAQIAVWDSGEEAGPAAVFLHGFPENRLCWQPVLNRLEERIPGVRWIAYDLRGFGESSKTGEASWQQLVGDHLEVIEKLGLHRYHLVGHDWGGAIALHIARLTPEFLTSACILNTTFWKIDYWGMWHVWLLNLPVLPRLLFGRTPDWFFQKTIMRAFNEPERLSGESRSSYLRMYRDRSTYDFWIRLYRHMVRHMLASAFPPALKARVTSSHVELPKTSRNAFRLPIQLIWGADDTFCPLWVGRSIKSRLQELGAEVELHEVAQSGHFVTEEQPERVAELLGGWFESCGE